MEHFWELQRRLRVLIWPPPRSFPPFPPLDCALAEAASDDDNGSRRRNGNIRTLHKKT